MSRPGSPRDTSKAKRPELDRLLADAHRRAFDTGLVWKLDRLGRSLSHLIRLVETFGSLGVDLVSLGDPGMDTTSPHGKLLFTIMAGVAEFERDLIRERTRAGMAAAKRRGKRLGRPRAVSGPDIFKLEPGGERRNRQELPFNQSDSWCLHSRM